MAEYRQSAHAVYDIKYHVIWITKYRYKILRGRIEVVLVVWTKKRRFLDRARAADEGGGREAAVHSGLASALGSHPCVALSS